MTTDERVRAEKIGFSPLNNKPTQISKDKIIPLEKDINNEILDFPEVIKVEPFFSLLTYLHYYSEGKNKA